MQLPEFEQIVQSYDPETGIGRISIDRPEKLNTLTGVSRREIVEALEAFERLDDESEGLAVRVVVLEGTGEHFSAGADVDEFDADGFHELTPVRMYDALESYGAPVIAKIDGYCLGGGLELALACDFRLADEESQLGQTEVNFGLCPGGGATQRLPDLVGLSRAKELCMTGERLSGVEAAEEDIVDYAYPGDDLEREVESFAERLASKPPLAVRSIKHLTNHSRSVGVEEGHRYEWSQFYSLMESRDYEEAQRAFSEDFEPEWEGR
jgi:enoyl-CoA hydratase/carnithine racemase